MEKAAAVKGGPRFFRWFARGTREKPAAIRRRVNVSLTSVVAGGGITALQEDHGSSGGDAGEGRDEAGSVLSMQLKVNDGG